jgi:hypothetical protein
VVIIFAFLDLEKNFSFSDSLLELFQIYRPVFHLRFKGKGE